MAFVTNSKSSRDAHWLGPGYPEATEDGQPEDQSVPVAEADAIEGTAGAGKEAGHTELHLRAPLGPGLQPPGLPRCCLNWSHRHGEHCCDGNHIRSFPECRLAVLLLTQMQKEQFFKALNSKL